VRVNVKGIADRIKVSRTTLQEHLNKAENKLVSSVIPQIQLYTRKKRAKRSTALGVKLIHGFSNLLRREL